MPEHLRAQFFLPTQDSTRSPRKRRRSQVRGKHPALFCTSADIKKKQEKHEDRSIELVSKHSHVITYVVINQMSLPCVSFPVILLEPVNENLHISSHNDNEDEEVMGLDDMQHMRDAQEEKEEGGTRGEDWEEVRFSANIYIM